MSESNNNVPMRITQLEEAETFDYESFVPNAKSGSGTKKVKGSTLLAELIDVRKGADSVTYENASDAINSQISNKLFKYINLYDSEDEDIETGGFYTSSNVWTSASGFMESGYIPVHEGFPYRGSGWEASFRTNIVFFDSSKNYLSGIQTLENGYLIPPENAVFLRVPIAISDRYSFTFMQMAEIPPTNREYNKTYIEVDGIIVNGSNIVEEIDQNSETIKDIVGMQNLFNGNDEDIVLNKFISGINNGEPVWSNFAGIGESGYIPVKPNDKFIGFEAISKSIYDNTRVALFDKNKNIISVTERAGADNYYTASSNTYYIRFPFTINTKNEFMVIVKRTEDPSPFTADNIDYIPYVKHQIEYLLKKSENTPTEEEIDEIRQEIAQSVGIGAQWENKIWYAYGTSITSVHQGTGKYPTYLAQMSGMTLNEKGIGGGGIGNLGAYSTGQVYNAICNITDGKLNADLITLETGANDVAEDTPLGTIFDTGQTTLAGCLNDCIRYLQENTNAQIVVTPSPTAKNLGAAFEKYETWAQMIEQICAVNRVHFIRPDNNMGVAKLESSNGSLYVVDSIHQTDLGGFIMAQNIWYQLRNIPLFYTSIPT